MRVKEIPLSVPKLPSADQILPYLRQIDKNRWYTNYGPLVNAFLTRVADLLQIQRTQVMCGINGTILLQICLTALGVERGTVCLMPAWTFVATPLAALGAGLEPVFVDVEQDTQAVDLKKLEADLPSLAKQFGKIGAVMITAPFGHPVDIKACDAFTARTNIPVVVDAAAGFDTLLQCPEMHLCKTPIMVSLHATKVLSMGEGGLILSANEELIIQLENMTQFGFPKGVRNAYALGTNAKISEYSAAVGLASLDQWSETRAGWAASSLCYQKLLHRAGIAHFLMPNCVTSVCNIIVPDAADNILAAGRIFARKWWGDGCHRQYQFQHNRRTDLTNTEFLQRSVLGIPFYIGMKQEAMAAVVSELSLWCEQYSNMSSASLI